MPWLYPYLHINTYILHISHDIYLRMEEVYYIYLFFCTVVCIQCCSCCVHSVKCECESCKGEEYQVLVQRMFLKECNHYYTHPTFTCPTTLPPKCPKNQSALPIARRRRGHSPLQVVVLEHHQWSQCCCG
jgi:hypothetical protein